MATTWTLPRWAGIALLAGALGGMALGGFGLGVLTAAHAPADAPSGGPGAARAGSPPASPFAVGAALPQGRVLDALDGKPAALALGRKATVVMGMASWCLFCGYEDRWVLPALAREPGVAADVVDLSPQGGIADPGPQSPPFHGQDGTGGPLDTRGMLATMRHYVARYRGMPGVHVYVAPAAVRSAWPVQGFPTLAFADRRGTVTQVVPGGLTLPQATAALQQAERP